MGNGAAWMPIVHRINTVAVLNKVMSSTYYSLENIDQVPLDVIAIAKVLAAGE